MNAAIVYSGQIRNFKECYPTHLKRIIQTNPDYKFHIFAHFWDDPSMYGKPYWEQYPHRGYWSEDNVASFIDCNPEAYIIEKPITFQSSLTPDPRFPHPIQNVMSMFYSLLSGGMLMNNNRVIRQIKFDVVFRMRTDLFFLQDLILSNYDMSNLWVNQQYIHMPYAVNDLFSFGCEEQMDRYFSVFQYLEAAAKAGCAINPECFLGFHLKATKAKVAQTPLQNSIYRLYRDL